VLTLLVLLTVGCGSDNATRISLDQTDLAESGQTCVSHGSAGAELCFKYDGGVVTIVGSGLAQDSTTTVTGAKGDSVNFEIGADESLESEIGARLILPPFTAVGTWNDGEPAVLTVAVAD